MMFLGKYILILLFQEKSFSICLIIRAYFLMQTKFWEIKIKKLVKTLN
jgi:hypothetical protein